MTDTVKKPRGLAAMSPERRREIASMGGKSSIGGFRNMSPETKRRVQSMGGIASQAKARKAKK